MLHIFISIMSISSPNSMFDHLLESSHRDDSNKWSNMRFAEKITQAESIEVDFTHLIWNLAAFYLILFLRNKFVSNPGTF